MTVKIGLKQRKCHFLPNISLRETDFEDLDISTAKQKHTMQPFNMLCVVIIPVSC